MAFPDPAAMKQISAAVTSTATQSLPRTGMGVGNSQYANANNDMQFRISHQIGKRVRRVARIDKQLLVPDPLFDGVNSLQSYSVYLVTDYPKVGIGPTEVSLSVKELTTWFADTSFANLPRFLGGEI